MPQLSEEFDAYLETQRSSSDYELQQAFDQHQKDLAAGGSIRQAPIEYNPPIGAIIGGIGGASLGVAAANPALAFGLGALGAAGGEAVQQIVEHGIGSPAAPKDSLESARRMLEESGMQTIGEGIGRVVGIPLAGRTLLRPSKYVTPEGAKAMKFLEPRVEQGYLPAEVTDNWGTDILHNISEHALIGGGAIKTFKKNRDALFQGIADELIDNIGPRMNADDAGRALKDAIQGNLEMARMPTTMLYNSIERMAAPDYVPVPIKMSVKRETSDIMETQKGREVVRPRREVTQEAEPGLESPQRGKRAFDTGWTTPDTPEETSLRGLKVKTMWQDVKVGERLEHLKVAVDMQEQQIYGAKVHLGPIKDKIAGLVRTAQQAGGLADREMGTTLLKFLDEKPEIMSYPAAKQMRTAIRTFQETLQNSPETKYAPAIAKAKNLYAQLTTQIRQGLKEHDPFLAEQWDEANVLEKGAQWQFNDKMVRALIKKSDEMGTGAPEKMAQMLFKPNNITTIKRVKNAVADDVAWQKMLSVQMQSLMAKATTKSGELDGELLEQAMFGRSGLGAETMTAAFGPQRVAQYREFINAVKVAQHRQASGTGSTFIQWRQGGAALQLAGVTAAAAGLSSDEYQAEGVLSGTAFILSPYMISRLMTNPTTAKMIIQGLKTPAGTPAAAGLFGRIIAAAIPSKASLYTPPDTAERRTKAMPSSTVRPMALQE